MRGWPVAVALALAIAALGLITSNAAAQEPSPIPNWTTGAPGTSSGQYAQNPYPQQPQYSQQPQYGQPPAYQQPPAYGQPQYQQPAYGQQPPYGQDYGQQAYGAPDQGYNAPYQPSRALSPDQLEQLVAPIALYPDNLLSMVLAASTYPAEVSASDQWLHMQGGAPPAQIAAAASEQGSWDPSIKALTAFPQVLDELAQNLQWTTDLGNAYYNQPQDVMQTVQVMRGRAQTAGNLQTTPQEVVTEDQGNIEIAPPTPDMVYVPAYNPWAVYGQPVNPYPDFNIIGAIGSFIGNALINWGPGIAMQAFSFTPFGWLGWGLDWLGHAIFFNHDVWSTHSGEVRDWGFAHGGGRYWGAHGEMAAYRDHRGWGDRGGEQHTFRSGLDRGGWGNGVRGRPQPVLGGNQAFGNRGGQNFGRGNGFGYGSRNDGYGQQAYNHQPQVIGHPQQFEGARPFDGRSQGYGSSTYGGNRTYSYGNGYGRQSFGSSGIYNRPSPSFGSQGGYGLSNRSLGYGSGSRAYGGYAGSNNYARGSSGNGFWGGHSDAYSYGGGSYKAPKSSGFGGGRSWGGGGWGGGGYKAPKAPHFSGGGGSHFGGGHSGGGGGHHSGGHSGGGGGHHSGGGGHGGKHH